MAKKAPLLSVSVYYISRASLFLWLRFDVGHHQALDILLKAEGKGVNK